MTGIDEKITVELTYDECVEITRAVAARIANMVEIMEEFHKRCPEYAYALQEEVHACEAVDKKLRPIFERVHSRAESVQTNPEVPA